MTNEQLRQCIQRTVEQERAQRHAEMVGVTVPVPWLETDVLSEGREILIVS